MIMKRVRRMMLKCAWRFYIYNFKRDKLKTTLRSSLKYYIHLKEFLDDKEHNVSDNNPS